MLSYDCSSCQPAGNRLFWDGNRLLGSISYKLYPDLAVAITDGLGNFYENLGTFDVIGTCRDAHSNSISFFDSVSLKVRLVHARVDFSKNSTSRSLAKPPRSRNCVPLWRRQSRDESISWIHKRSFNWEVAFCFPPTFLHSIKNLQIYI